jgi:hypothetical protein
MKMTVTEITTGNSGNGSTDILKELIITRKHSFIPISVCAYYSILPPRLMNDRSLLFVDELFGRVVQIRDVGMGKVKSDMRDLKCEYCGQPDGGSEKNVVINEDTNTNESTTWIRQIKIKNKVNRNSEGP